MGGCGGRGGVVEAEVVGESEKEGGGEEVERGEVNSARAKNEISRPSPRRQRGSNPHLMISIRFY